MQLNIFKVVCVVVLTSVVLCDDLQGERRCTEVINAIETVKTTYKCKRHNRWEICSKTQPKAVTKRVTVCCPGWSYEGGKCVSVMPICNPLCVNAQCTSTNTCTCNQDFVNLNATHCGPQCDADFYNDLTTTNFNCIPKCKQPCVNGNCTDIDTCVCKEGYRLKPGSKFQCDPVCDSCVNGICRAPNKCSCLPGFVDRNDGECRPVCDKCDNGECVAPNTCICNKGYTKKGELCLPICDEECSNGTCTAPNVCSCNTNYKIDVINKFKCNPVCNNRCINATCVSPETCACNNGFEPADNYWTCRPKCESCENGLCVAPNKCSCLSGYRDKNDGKCRPVCDHCEHGDCIAPNICVCHEGYTRSGDLCVPVCVKECSNGTCSGPNECTCNQNYKLDDDNRFKCNPICKNKCVNATCVAPDMCACSKGFEATENLSSCRPICESCDNGNCIAPNKCICNKGYAKNDTDVCEPVCREPCINGKCAAPDSCECLPGYAYESPNRCHPICNERCYNSTCVSPDKCECWSGYITSDTSNACKPLCTACDNGDCLAPALCRCHAGYEAINGTCHSLEIANCRECDGYCNNSVCVCANGRSCYDTTEQAGIASAPALASLQLTWVMGSALSLLLIIIVIFIIHRIWKQRKNLEQKAAGENYNIGSLVYTVPDTLIHRGDPSVDFGHDEDQDIDDLESRQQEAVLLQRVSSADHIERI